MMNSRQEIYQWIKERENHPENEIEAYHVVKDHFPDDHYEPSGDCVDIMTVTPESACWCAYLGRFH